MSGYFANQQERGEYIAGMRAFLDYLEAHPEVPTQRREHIQLSTWGATMADRVETVDEFAAMTGAKPYWDGDYYYAEIEFGPIKFFAVAIRKATDPEAACSHGAGCAQCAMVAPQSEAAGAVA